MWTKPEIDQLRQLASEGMCKLKVAAVMGKGVDDVRAMCRLAGVKLSRSRLQAIKHWTQEEYQFALKLQGAGLTPTEIGNEMGRSKSSVLNAIKRYTDYTPAPRDLDVGSAIGQTMDDRAYLKDCKLGSQILREACMDLFCRAANRYHISLDDAMACHLGYHAQPKREPGADRVIRGQFAERRLAA